MSTKSECCDFTMEYHEVLIDYKGVVGHIDAIFKDSKGRYWILDFKTCTVKGKTYKQKSPGAAYIEQVETYALMLYKQYGIKVEGVMLMFIPRDDPTEPSVWVRLIDSDDLKRIAKRVKQYKQQHREALNAETLEEALALAEYGKCKGDHCKVCKSSLSLKQQLRKAYKVGKKMNHLPLINLK
jgi:CRISPR/Cas system-associated exonuclease Cas4 (RecB family)